MSWVMSNCVDHYFLKLSVKVEEEEEDDIYCFFSHSINFLSLSMDTT